MNKIESEALDQITTALGGLYAHLGMVMRGESPHTGAVSWYASGKVPLIDRFAGYSLTREQCLTIYAAMKTVFEKSDPVFPHGPEHR